MGRITMATHLGTHNERLKAVRSLRTGKGRRERGRFAFEGATLLQEARESGFPIAELYVTQEAYEATPLVRQLENDGISTFIVEPSGAAHISDLVTPSGIVAVAPLQLRSAAELFERGSPLLVLADVADPSNAGTLLRSADAFGCAGVVFGSLGVEPYHPKVVRGSMGAVFRLALAVAEPGEVGEAAAARRFRLFDLTAAGEPLGPSLLTPPVAILVGHERHGLGRWEALCTGSIGIPMAGRAESLSAAVAGSIALYEATKRTPTT